MKKILFTEPNRIATVEGRKTNTRRMIKSRTGFFNVESKNGIVTNIWQTDANGWPGDDLMPVKPRYQVGEIVYIAEPYKVIRGDFDIIGITYTDGKLKVFDSLDVNVDYEWFYKRQKEMRKSKSGFCNKMFMPEWAARDFIRITDVKAERLQDIINEDCFKEGIFKHISHARVYWKFPGSYDMYFNSPCEAYAAEIDHINGKGTWDSNPFMWSYYYELVKK
jgi:hypothetical protein